MIENIFNILAKHFEKFILQFKLKNNFVDQLNFKNGIIEIRTWDQMMECADKPFGPPTMIDFKIEHLLCREKIEAILQDTLFEPRALLEQTVADTMTQTLEIRDAILTRTKKLRWLNNH